jgi:hypothetical protein
MHVVSAFSLADLKHQYSENGDIFVFLYFCSKFYKRLITLTTELNTQLSSLFG